MLDWNKHKDLSSNSAQIQSDPLYLPYFFQMYPDTLVIGITKNIYPDFSPSSILWNKTKNDFIT